MGLLGRLFGKDQPEDRNFDGYVDIGSAPVGEQPSPEPTHEPSQKEIVSARLGRLQRVLDDFAVAARKYPIVLNDRAASNVVARLKDMQEGTLRTVTELLSGQPENLDSILGRPMSRDRAVDWNVMIGTEVSVSGDRKLFRFKFPGEGERATHMRIYGVAETGSEICRALQHALNRDFLPPEVVNELAREISAVIKTTYAYR